VVVKLVVWISNTSIIINDITGWPGGPTFRGHNQERVGGGRIAQWDRRRSGQADQTSGPGYRAAAAARGFMALSSLAYFCLT